jgi:hypothetical protein
LLDTPSPSGAATLSMQSGGSESWTARSLSRELDGLPLLARSGSDVTIAR